MSRRTSMSRGRKWRLNFGCVPFHARTIVVLPPPSLAALKSWWKSIARNCWKLIFKGMVIEPTTETVAARCWLEARRVCLELADGRFVSFPAVKYPLLAKAPQNLLKKLKLRLNGLDRKSTRLNSSHANI